MTANDRQREVLRAAAVVLLELADTFEGWDTTEAGKTVERRYVVDLGNGMDLEFVTSPGAVSVHLHDTPLT
jgi:hypothetical protein